MAREPILGDLNLGLKRSLRDNSSLIIKGLAKIHTISGDINFSNRVDIEYLKENILYLKRVYENIERDVLNKAEKKAKKPVVVLAQEFEDFDHSISKIPMDVRREFKENVPPKNKQLRYWIQKCISNMEYFKSSYTTLNEQEQVGCIRQQYHLLFLLSKVIDGKIKLQGTNTEQYRKFRRKKRVRLKQEVIENG